MTISFRPLSPFVGAEISGFDPSAPIDEATAGALRAGLARHHLLLLRRPGLTTDEQIAITRIYGSSLNRNSYDGNVGKEAYYISNDRPDGVLRTGEIEFHHDHLFYAEPLKVGLLYAIDVPASGSVTRFRSCKAFLDLLPADLRQRAEGIECLHFFNYDDNHGGKQDPTKHSPRAQQAWHPLVWTNPETAERALWAVRITAVDYRGIDKEAGDALIEQLWEIGERHDEIVYAHTWQPGDLVVWDNKMLAHARLPFQSHEPRTLRRTSAI